ncbi:MAG: Ig-like domain-containing protein [Streptosporangiales bacterium]
MFSFLTGDGSHAEPTRRRLGTYATVAALTVALGSAAACSPVDSAERQGGQATHSASPIPKPTVDVRGKESKLSYRSPIKITAEHGAINSVTVTSENDTKLAGSTSDDGSSWTSKRRPLPRTSYQAKVTVRDTADKTYTKNLDLHVRTVPVENRLTFNVTPNSGTRVGVGQPVVVQFTTPVTHRRRVEKAMHVNADTPSGKPVKGSWHWLSDQVVHWRPKHFWHPGTKVKLHMATAGVRASDDRWGRKDYTQKFTIGSSSVLRVNARTHMMRVYRDGKHVATWPTGTGMREYPTRNGTYIVLNKSSKYHMTSCSAGIACKKSDPKFYSTTVHYAVRVTTSGTFVHAAPWDNLMGQANTSHGCIHLSTTHAHRYYRHAKPGDVVIVKGSNQGPQERVAVGDPGLVDWNIPWSQWKAGSALK